jgi:hypothetical protein
MAQRGDERRDLPERATGAKAEDQVLGAVQAVAPAVVTAASRQRGVLDTGSGTHDLAERKDMDGGPASAVRRRH